MLSMLRVMPEQEKGAFYRLRRRFFYPPVDGVIVNAGLTPYLRIEALSAQKGVDWRMIASYCMEPAGRLLLPKNVQCPRESGLRGFVPTAFRRKLLESLLKDVLACMKTPPAKRILAVYGREAETAALLPGLSPLVGEVRIITRREYAIRSVTEELLEQTGMPVTITPDLDARGCGLLFASDGGAGMIQSDSDCVVLSPSRPQCREALWVSSARAALPAELEDDYLPEYDINEFVGAFYELAGRLEFGDRSPACGVSCGRVISVSEISKAADRWHSVHV